MNTRKIKEKLQYIVLHHSYIPIGYDDSTHINILEKESAAFNKRNPTCDSALFYHYVILPSGNVLHRVPAGIYAAHCGKNSGDYGKINNDNSIAICVSARLDQEKMTDAQWKSLVNEVKYQSEKHNLKIVKHSDVVSTACPGKNFPFKQLLKEIKMEKKPIIKKLYPDVDEKRWSYEAIEYVTKAGLMVGDENDMFHPYEPCTREELAAVIYNLERKK